MLNKFQSKVWIISIIFIVVFVSYVLISEQKKQSHETRQLQNHAAVVANALWTLAPESPKEYLSLVAKYDNYERIQLFAIQEETPFLEVNGSKGNSMDLALIRVGLISRNFLSAPIYHDNEKIGRLDVIHLHRTIYGYLYYLLVWGLLWLATLFFLRTIRDKHTLEKRVRERTRELQENQERLRQSEKMDSIGQLAGGIAHDFNNMLGGILSAAELLQRHLPENDDRNRRMVSLINKSALRAAELTSQLLSFSRQNKSLSTSFDLRQIIHDAVALLERTINKQIEIKTTMLDTEIPIICDPAQLQSAILNIGINAGDAMGGKGNLTIKTEAVELDSAYCQAIHFDIQPGPYVELSIQDSGHGIALETQKHIFEPFYTTKEQGKGTGLGLAAVYGTICTHKGAIAVYSEPGQGTIFRIFLPLSDSIFVPATKRAVAPLQGSGYILVIDDEEVIRTSAKITLEDMGYEVALASDGEKGVAAFEAEHDRINLVILDMIMPKLGGIDTFRALRKIDPEARIIIASGFSKGDSINTLKQEGLLGFISKPYRRTELEQLLAEVM